MKNKFMNRILSACVALVLVSATNVYASTVKKDSYIEKKGITIEYFAHSSFGISNSEGLQIVTDPYADWVGYTFPSGISTPIVTTSHEHDDHNYVAALEGYDQLINETGSFTSGDIKIKGIAASHGDIEGYDLGPNTIYTYEINKIKVCHLGDLGYELTEEQISNIGEVDVLMIPVGGFFTIDAEKAVKVVNSINPKIVIPMHYETDVTEVTFEDLLAPAEDFTSKLGWEVENVDNLTLTKQMLNTMKTKKVFVLDFK